MSHISLNIAIPRYDGAYHEAMERIFSITQNEEMIFTYFFAEKFDYGEVIQTANAVYNTAAPDVAYSVYHGMPNFQANPVSMILLDLVTIFNHLGQFYRAQPFVKRLMDQSRYLGKRIVVDKMIPDGATILII